MKPQLRCCSCVQIAAWLSFTMMTQCLPVGIFTLAGAYQMTVWALGKHRNYRKEFEVSSILLSHKNYNSHE